MKKIKIPRRYIYLMAIIAICTAMTTLFSVSTAEPPKLTENKLDTNLEEIIQTEKIKEVPEIPEPPVEIPEPENAESVAAFEPIMPVKGEILKEYHEKTLVYSNTLKDYRTHPGVDIKGQILDKVYAVEKGVVEDFFDDSLMGNTIVIDHKNGYKSIYSNLSTLDMVQMGKEVEKGTIISGIGDTALLETGDEAHLHFEMKKDGETVNPLPYIKE